ncbi:TRF2-interacting telomeric protein/Rap1 C terminal domain-containing protein [Durotheca rogersii]|uniref:TRF2-interacting telomeric protein/Rap1 C terminal domain-containing protein n=1 Tax=Durotheca rogersii TaxID=419775 RepID=UPI00221E91DD|nr:TRF2-interacting telomeric protein/Rap1 C terminal domain-containing protein [Durotheca rogersii]KAI5861298.1 TRF2-interacting telomeric protein/Rap1 C terminal domain-containing protein [Durotheca rogersii]
MPAGIVYEGAAAPAVPPDNGVFSGLKFWIGRRVPDRTTVSRAVHSNGGKVVALEKYANYRIYDHARKDAPPGSCSYRFITDSVAAGALKDPQDYLCVRVSSGTRSGQSEPGSSAPQKQTRTKFTTEDDLILYRWVKGMVGAGKRAGGMEIYKDLAKKHPHHTYQSWRSRWVDVLSFRRPSLEPPSPSARSPRVTRSAGVEHTPIRTRKSLSVRDHVSTGETEEIDVAPAPRVANGKAKSHAANREEREPLPTAKKTQPRQKPRNVSSGPSESISSEDSMVEKFHRYYRDFLEGEERPMVFHSTVRGRTFGMWDLWRAVDSLKMEPAERDWQQIAETMGFDWVQHETVPDELRRCYEKYLADFEEALRAFENEQLGEEEGGEEEEGEEEGGEEEEEEEDQSEGQNQELGTETTLPSSPPAPSLKRPLTTELSDPSCAYPQSPKRRRIDRKSVIPSTPDEVNGTSHLRPRPGANVTPRARKPDATNTEVALQSSPLRHVVDEEADEDESRDTLGELCNPFQRPKKVPEPETQDFGFDADTQVNIDDAESQCGITPSQQLLLESDAAISIMEDGSPTPKARTRNLSPTSPPPRRSTARSSRDGPAGKTPRPSTANYTKDDTASPTLSRGKAERRSLPHSYVRSPPAAVKTSGGSSSKRLDHPKDQPPKQPILVLETEDQVVDHFCSLGYPRDIVLRALRATTWRLGDAGQVMEMLKRGEELPQRTRGVWTRRDDEALRLVSLEEPPKDEREQRKRAGARRMLEAKHGLELMDVRREYLWGGPKNQDLH